MISFDICEGNPGCLTFLMEAYKMDALIAEKCFSRMQLYGIRAEQLYMLWNDCCGRDTMFALAVMQEATVEELNGHIFSGVRGIPFTPAERETIADRLWKYWR